MLFPRFEAFFLKGPRGLPCLQLPCKAAKTHWNCVFLPFSCVRLLNFYPNCHQLLFQSHKVKSKKSWPRLTCQCYRSSHQKAAHTKKAHKRHGNHQVRPAFAELDVFFQSVLECFKVLISFVFWAYNSWQWVKKIGLKQHKKNCGR